MPFYIKSSIPGSVAYHTGELDRSLPPDPYITEALSEAASWDTREAAQAWIEQFGGEIIEISDQEFFREILPSVSYQTQVDTIERDGEDCVLTLRIKGGKAFAGGWSLKTKMNVEVFREE